MTAATKATATVSALDVEPFRSRHSSTIFSMNHLLYRSAYSTLMRESRDRGFMLACPDGTLDKDATEALRSRMAAAAAVQSAGSA